MKSKQSKHIAKRLMMWAIGVAALLSITFLARFPWTTGDFIFAGIVLFGAASVFEITTRDMSKKNRLYVGVAVLMIVFLWVLPAPA